jgi:hypothetical protein
MFLIASPRPPPEPDAAPSLSQLMHGRETGAGPVEVPSLDTEKELEFD